VLIYSTKVKQPTGEVDWCMTGVVYSWYIAMSLDALRDWPNTRETHCNFSAKEGLRKAETKEEFESVSLTAWRVFYPYH